MLVLLLVLALSPLIAAIVVLAMAYIAAERYFGWATLRWRAWRRGERLYFVCSPRAGWREFLANNVVAALPQGVVPLWIECKDAQTGGATVASICNHGATLRKPYLVEVRPLRTFARSLHNELLPFKRFGRADHDVQCILRELLRAEIFPDASRPPPAPEDELQ